MELKTFIEQTIKDICQGVLAAKKGYRDDQSLVAPRQLGVPAKPDNMTKIHFELVVEASESTNNGGGGGINVMSILLAGGKIENSESIKNTNKIVFDIPFAPQYLEGKD